MKCIFYMICNSNLGSDYVITTSTSVQNEVYDQITDLRYYRINHIASLTLVLLQNEAYA